MEAKADQQKERSDNRKENKQKFKRFQKENKTHVIPDSLVESNSYPPKLRKPRKNGNGQSGEKSPPKSRKPRIIAKGNSGQNKVSKQNAELHRQHCKDKNLKAKGQKSCDFPYKPKIDACAKEWRHAKEYDKNDEYNVWWYRFPIFSSYQNRFNIYYRDIWTSNFLIQ